MADAEGKGDGDARATTPWWKGGFKVPFAVALLGVTIATAAAIAAPLGVLSFSGATKSTDTMTDALRGRLVATASDSVLRLSDKCFAAVDDIRNLQSVGTYFAAYDLDKSKRITQAPYADSLINDLITVAERYNFTVAFNVATRLPGIGGAENLLLGAKNAQGFYEGRRCNELNATFQICDGGAFSQKGNVWNRTVDFYAFSTFEVPKTSEMFPASENGLWLPTVIFPYNGQHIPTKVCYKAPSFLDRTPQTDFYAGMGNYTAMFSGVYRLASISEYLMTVVPTKNAVLAVFDIPHGALVGVSKAGLTMNADESATVNIADVADPLLRESATAVYERYGKSWTALPASLDTTVKTSQGNVLISTKALTTDQGLAWMLVIAIPEDDLIGDMIRARKAAIITAIVVSVGMIILAAVAATKFDFSVVNSSKSNKRSFLNELANMQDVFYIMLTKFAKAIEANKSLQRGKGNPTTSAQQASVIHSASTKNQSGAAL
ncbi:uncharacterized protein EV422DRAFT_508298 [Fimicolochytrium jonesii]|uniref:uncharacterized protein n=1 Tax=Fimicolochytrium jonesii TaxID=1396493 RepID=UPI0022FEFDF3|nr:uncharacterized protein EV422DRAFT_508298 [Fimicolochytrium jonesii]KAI8818439.1 hypothetical protein EV422DRAFT_508298 [Fimicolochytrium jonesii]